MNQLPRSINTWDKLQYFIRCIDEAVVAKEKFRVRVVFYSPWDKASKKVKGHDCRVNLFDVPEAYHILKDVYELPPLNYLPTMLTFTSKALADGTYELVIQMNDNATAIQHELVSGG